MASRARRRFRPAVALLDKRWLLAGLSPAQINSAYGLNAIAFNANGATVKGDGSGQTIALIEVDHDPYLASDLATFDATYHLTAAAMTQVDLAGSTTNSEWASEETLDVEWAHAIAPGAKLVVVEAKSSAVKSLLAAVKLARATPGVSVVSMSWTASGFPGEAADNHVFTTPAGHTGITYVAATGDYGVQGGAQWPASSPNVVGVGGTTLIVTASGRYLRESVWAGSSGGVSLYESEPAYQRSLNSAGRTTPDVSFDGDPNTGVAVYTTDPSSGQGAWQMIGGTSFGTPAWAAIFAIVDQGRSLDGKGTLKGATQTLPALYTLPASAFHKVAAYLPGSHSNDPPVASAGLGTPNGEALVAGLVSFEPEAAKSAAKAKHAALPKVRHPAALAEAEHPARTAPGHDRRSPEG